MIIAPLNTLFQSIVTEIVNEKRQTDSTFSLDFTTCPIWEFNERNDPQFPVCLFALPLKKRESTGQAGIIGHKYIVDVWFLNKSELSDRQNDRTGNVDAMDSLRRTFLKKLYNHSTVISVDLVEITDEYNQDDVNVDGVKMSVEFEINDNIC